MKRFLIFIASVVVFSQLLIACGSASTNTTPVVKPTTLVVTRIPDHPPTTFSSFTARTITDARRVQQFYDFLYTLPQAPQSMTK